MQDVVSHLRAHFDTLTDRMHAFARHGVQTEGWFKGELLLALDRLTEGAIIQRFDREVRVPSGRVDLRVEREGVHWVELKHWLIGEQRGTRYGPGFYFKDPSSVGVSGDATKLLSIGGEGSRWLLVLLAANPGEAAWASGISAFNAKFAPRHLTGFSDPSQYPDSYFLGLLQVTAVAV